MNERIKEFAQYAGATNECGGRAESVFCFTSTELNNFAELIVKECLNQIKALRDSKIDVAAQNNGRSSDFAFGAVTACEHLDEDIRKQFGIKE